MSGTLLQRLEELAQAQFGEEVTVHFDSEKQVSVRHGSVRYAEYSMQQLLDYLEVGRSELEGMFLAYWSQRLPVSTYEELCTKMRQLDSFDFPT